MKSSREKNNNTLLNALVLMVSFLLFGVIFMLFMMSNVEVEYVEIAQDPIYKFVDEIVDVDVYHQETPIIPVTREGKELILIDKSGSMEEFITDLYRNNIEFFKENDVWAFDTEVYKKISIDNVEFSGDTNLFQAVNQAADEGYETVWICSDLEHNRGEIKLSDLGCQMQIIVYSPKILNREKTDSVVTELQQANLKIITIN